MNQTIFYNPSNLVTSTTKCTLILQLATAWSTTHDVHRSKGQMYHPSNSHLKMHRVLAHPCNMGSGEGICSHSCSVSPSEGNLLIRTPCRRTTRVPGSECSIAQLCRWVQNKKDMRLNEVGGTLPEQSPRYPTVGSPNSFLRECEILQIQTHRLPPLHPRCGDPAYFSTNSLLPYGED